MAKKYITIEDMQELIEDGEIMQSRVPVKLLQIDAAKSFAAEFKNKVKGVALHAKLREFLESKDFITTVFNIILNAKTSDVQSDKHLTYEELKHLKNHSAKTEEILNICSKLRKSMQTILTPNEKEETSNEFTELEYNTILFQGLFIYYTDIINHKLNTNNNI